MATLTAAYSQTITNGDGITTSGQIALDVSGNLVGANDVKAQTIQCLTNMLDRISEEGFERHNIEALTIFLQDIEEDFGAFDQGFREFFGDCKPCRTTVQATLFKPEFLVELNGTANKNIDNRR